eukprot:3946646-Amphidinium_carterae.2
MCRRCVEVNWDNFITAVGFGGLIAQPGAPGNARSAINRLRTVLTVCAIHFQTCKKRDRTNMDA